MCVIFSDCSHGTPVGALERQRKNGQVTACGQIGKADEILHDDAAATEQRSVDSAIAVRGGNIQAQQSYSRSDEHLCRLEPKVGEVPEIAVSIGDPTAPAGGKEDTREASEHRSWSGNASSSVIDGR